MPRDRLGSWQELDPWLEVASGREGKPAPQSPEKGRACRQRGTGLLGGDPGPQLPESAPESPVCRAFSMSVLVIGLFTSFFLLWRLYLSKNKPTSPSSSVLLAYSCL